MLYVRFLFWLLAYLAIAPIFIVAALLVWVLEGPIDFVDRIRRDLLVDLDYGNAGSIRRWIFNIVHGAPWP
jgi:hypothetical protein